VPKIYTSPIFIILLWLLYGLQVQASIPAQCDTVYAVHDKNVANSQFFTYQLQKNQLQPLGELLDATDIEGLAVHPNTHQLYASNGQLNAQLYHVDGQTGELNLLGDIGYDNVVGLAFHPIENTLWGWSSQGLLQIDLTTAAGTLILANQSLPIQSLTWNQDGTRLYATAADTKTHSTLLQWLPGRQHWEVACDNLPPKVEGLETTPDGSLVYGYHNDADLGIHIYDPLNCQETAEGQIKTLYNDIEGIAWSTYSCTISNLQALRTYLESLEGVTAVDIQNDGAIAVTLNGETQYSQLDPTSLIAGTPPTDEQLILTPIADDNCDGIDDFQITYPSGDQQILHDFGTSLPLPPPVLTPPTLDPTVASLLDTTSAFLYSGSNPIQTGVAPNTIDPIQVAVIRGQVTGCQGKPLSNVTISVLNHPEYGSTKTRADGQFDIAVNGGNALTINYQKAGFLPIQRTINVPWQEYAPADPVAMISADPQVSHIDLSANQPIQVAQGTAITDEDGTRQATLLFPAGTTATMVFPDEQTQPLTELAVRLTEYTVGPNGPQAMPAELPPNTAYTYAVELTVDQAVAAGASHINFSQPIPLYVDNFLNFPTGTVVPAGWYDPTKATWLGLPDGLVIEILEITNKLAILDLEGEGNPATPEQLTELGITSAEQQQLAQLYAPGHQVWRTPIPHFSTIDLNWTLVAPNGAKYPDVDPKTGEEGPDDNDCQSGSIIECQSQIFGETLPIAGTGLTLNYRSDRVVGRKAGRMIIIPLSKITQPSEFGGTLIEIRIAGRRIIKIPTTGSKEYVFVWDGKDAYGRLLQGEQPVRYRIGYQYQGYYALGRRSNSSGSSAASHSFGKKPAGGSRGPITRNGATLTYWTSWYSERLGTLWDVRGQGFGGWTVNLQHSYSPLGRGLVLGDGRKRQQAAILGGTISSLISKGLGGQKIAVSSSGHLYFVSYNREIKRLNPLDGTTKIIAGNGTNGCREPIIDNTPATEAALCLVHCLEIANDNSIYMCTLSLATGTNTNQILRITPDGLISTVVSSDQLPANTKTISGLALTPTNGFYLALEGRESPWNRSPQAIYHVDTTGHFNLMTEFSSFHGGIIDMELGQDGSLYYINWQSGNNKLMRLAPDAEQPEEIATADLKSLSHTISGPSWPSLTALATAPDGSLYLHFNIYKGPPNWSSSQGEYRVLNLGSDGILTVVAGGGEPEGHIGDGGAATAARLGSGHQNLAVAPDGTIYLGESNRGSRIRKIGPAMPGVGLSDIQVASEDGSVLYQFTRQGKHLRTLDTLTGLDLYQFTYDNNGYVIAITDLDGDVTTIERDENSLPKAIIAPDGQKTRLVLNQQGYLTRLVAPDKATYKMAYTEDGLLTRFTNPKGHTSKMQYDELGRFYFEENPVGGGWTIARVEEDDHYEISLSSALGGCPRILILLYNVK